MKYILCLLFVCFSFAENTTLFLISPPRSLSVGFLRMIEARGDFAIFHEPTNAPYDAIYYKDFYEKGFRPDCFHSYKEVTNAIHSAAEHSNVFVKEMAFTLQEYLHEDDPLLQTAHFAFLVRKPQDVILSMYRKMGGELFPTFKDLIGYRHMYALYQLVREHGKYPPVILFSEELGEHPAETVSCLCEQVGIAFKPESLSWNDLGKEFNGQEWKDGKNVEFVQHWHGEAIQSSGFIPLQTSAVDAEGNPTFVEIQNEEDREACEDAYRFSLPYYLKLKEAAQKSDVLRGC